MENAPLPEEQALPPRPQTDGAVPPVEPTVAAPLPPVEPAAPTTPLPPVQTTPVAPPAPAPVAQPQTITVDAAKLKALMDRLDEQAAQLSRLEAAASKAGLSNYDNKHRAKPGKAVKVRKYEDKITVGWRTISNIVEKNPDTKAWTEHQIIELIFEDDTTVQLPYSLWVGRYTLEDAEVKATTVLDDDSVVYTLKLKDDREIKLGQTFVN